MFKLPFIEGILQYPQIEDNKRSETPAAIPYSAASTTVIAKTCLSING